jgi:hypothetical protein
MTFLDDGNIILKELILSKNRASYTPRKTLGADQSPLASLGLSLFAKNIIGSVRRQAERLPCF